MSKHSFVKRSLFHARTAKQASPSASGSPAPRRSAPSPRRSPEESMPNVPRWHRGWLKRGPFGDHSAGSSPRAPRRSALALMAASGFRPNCSAQRHRRVLYVQCMCISLSLHTLRQSGSLRRPGVQQLVFREGTVLKAEQSSKTSYWFHAGNVFGGLSGPSTRAGTFRTANPGTG